MGRDKNEREFLKPARMDQGGGRSTRQASLINSYHPTEADKAALREGMTPIEEAIEILERQLQGGMKVTLSIAKYNNAYSVTVREQTPNWQEARALSAFGIDLVRAIRTLAHGLSGKYSEWPEAGQGWADFQDDW